MADPGSSGGTGGGGGGGISGYSPTQQKSDNSFNSAVQALAAQKSSSSSQQTMAKDPPVYLGAKYKPGTQDYYDMQRRGHSTDNVLTTSQASQMYFNFSQQDRDKFLAQLQLAGFDAASLNDNKLSQLWAGYVGQAAGYYASGKKVSPWDVLAKDMQQREAISTAPRTVTQTATSFDYSTKEASSALFEQAAQSLLGRNPTAKESKSFYAMLHSYEAAHPQTTTTTSRYEGADVKSSSQTTSGGIDATTRAYMAEQQAKADPQYGAYQAATTYMDALMNKIKSG